MLRDGETWREMLIDRENNINCLEIEKSDCKCLEMENMMKNAWDWEKLWKCLETEKRHRMLINWEIDGNVKRLMNGWRNLKRENAMEQIFKQTKHKAVFVFK